VGEEKERDQSRRLGWMSQARTPEKGGGEGEGGGAGEKPLAKYFWLIDLA
jgi:hypothetical protein